MGVLPVPVWKLTPHGSFGYVRHDASEGSAGASGVYPATHYGVDLVGEPGDEVRAPEDGEVIAVMANLPGKDVKPWTGYGPALVFIKGASGRFHLLAHLDPDDVKRRFPVWTSAELKDDGVIANGGDIRKYLQRPGVIAARDGTKTMPTVQAGEVVGVIGTARHVHWEVRKHELSRGYNPATWANTYIWHHKPPAEAADDVAATLKPEDSLAIVALVILGLVLWPGSKGKRR